MPAGLPVVIALLAQAASAPPATPPPTGNPPEKSSAEDPCASAKAASDDSHIVICAPRPNGYRINPDVMEAKRELKSRGRPRRQATEAPPPDCASVGPAPCVSAGINLLAAAATAAEMGKRLATGQEIGSMFITDPHPTEYQLYQMAKKRREAREAEEEAAARVKAKAAAAVAQPVSTSHNDQPAGQ